MFRKRNEYGKCNPLRTHVSIIAFPEKNVRRQKPPLSCDRGCMRPGSGEPGPFEARVHCPKREKVVPAIITVCVPKLRQTRTPSRTVPCCWWMATVPFTCGSKDSPAAHPWLRQTGRQKNSPRAVRCGEWSGTVADIMPRSRTHASAPSAGPTSHSAPSRYGALAIGRLLPDRNTCL